MKTCHTCGTFVDDKELICPECGATVVKHVDGFTLKDKSSVKKKTNPMGTTLSTGSGLTDILKGDDNGYDAEYDNDFMGGSIPVSLSRTEIDLDVSGKKKSNIGGTIFKLILFCAVAYGVYFVVVNVFLKKEGANEYSQVIDIYVDAINNVDESKMVEIMPPYVLDNLDTAEMMLDELKNNHIDEFSIVTVTNYGSEEINSLQVLIKLQSGKTVNISSACLVKVKTKGTKMNQSGKSVEKNSEFEVELIEVRDRWYLHLNTYDNPFE